MNKNQILAFAEAETTKGIIYSGVGTTDRAMGAGSPVKFLQLNIRVCSYRCAHPSMHVCIWDAHGEFQMELETQCKK